MSSCAHLTTSRALSSIVLASVVCVAAAPMAASGQAVYEVIAGFGGPRTPDGQSPSALVQASDGTFYGTTVGGGSSGAGTVFKIDGAGAVTTVYSFGGFHASPRVLIQGSDGNLYGTSVGGIFKIDPGGTLIPVTPAVTTSLSQGSDGNLYAIWPGSQGSVPSSLKERSSR